MSSSSSETQKNPETESVKTINPNQEPINPNQENNKNLTSDQDFQNPDIKSPNEQNPETESVKIMNSNEERLTPNGEDNGEGEEEEGECGFCLFMKGGECKETFINWEKCVEDGEKNNEDIVEKCFEVTSALKKCMEANQDYYGVILQAEKNAEQEVINQLDQEKAKEKEVASDANESSSREGEGRVEKKAEQEMS